MRVLYRHGYYAREQMTPPDRRTFLTLTRITAAAKYPHPISDIALTLEDPRFDEGKHVVTATGRIAPGEITFNVSVGLHVATVDALFACVDRKDRRVGDVTQTLDFKLTEENYQRFVRDGLSFSIRVPVSGEPVRLKAIVYDYERDAVGSRTVKLR